MATLGLRDPGHRRGHRPVGGPGRQGARRSVLRGGDIAQQLEGLGFGTLLIPGALQRVQALAQPDEVLVSRTVTDLVGGSGIEFQDRGDHELKGVPGSWRLFGVRG
jgi:hypothetical protein